MIRLLHSSIVLPAYETLLHRRKTLRYWKSLERTQWRAREELEQIQFEALLRLIQHAFAHCPYYREQWSQLGLKPGALESIDSFNRWPILSREIIRKNRLRLRAQIPGMTLMSKSTGGSSGEPLHFDLNSDSAQRREAAWHRGYSWARAEPGQKVLYLWGVPLTPRSKWADRKDALYRAIYRRTLLNTFDLSEERVPEYLERLNRCKPDAIVAYAHSLYAFARMLEERNLCPYSPKGIVVGAEKLHPFQRRLIERVFRAPVFETYGSREFMLMGAECDRHEGMHLTMENLLVEIVDDNGHPTPAGQEGNIVVTDLYNYGMPFVRYTNGDRAIAGFRNCSCGRGLPLLKQVVGRRSEMIRTPDGRHLTGLFFPHLMKDFPAVRRFLVVHDKPDHLQLRIVVSPEWRAGDAQILKSVIRNVIGPAMHIDVILVDNIPLTGSGQLQVVLNLCENGDDATERELEATGVR